MNLPLISEPTESDDLLELPSGELGDWLAVLKPYQSMHLTALIQSGLTSEQAAEAWLASTGPELTSGLGGSGRSKPFRERFKEEFRKFLCGKSYSKERTELKGKIEGTKAGLITAASVAIAANIGTSAALLVPPVAVFLQVVASVGLKAWCQGRNSAEKKSPEGIGPTEAA